MAAENEPSELYNRAKRNLVITVGLFGIVLLGLIGADDKPSVAGLHLSPEAIPTALATEAEARSDHGVAQGPLG